MSMANDSRGNLGLDKELNVSGVDNQDAVSTLAEKTTPQLVVNHIADKHDYGITTSEKELDDSSLSSFTSTGHKDHSWTTTFIRFGPLAGIFGLFLAIATLFISLGILVGSDGVSVTKWSVQPSALLAVCTAVGNQSMRFAAWQGVAIAWWVRASRSGSTIGQLHRDWRAGTTFRGAIMSARHLSWLGLACIFSTIVAVDGPFLQRATTVALVPIEGETVDLQVHISPEIPTDFTGVWETNRLETSVLWGNKIPTSSGEMDNDIIAIGSNEFLGEPSANWIKDTTLSGFIHGCPDNCTAKVMAPAVMKTSCTSHTVPVNYTRNIPPPEDAEITDYPLDSATVVVEIQLLVDEDTESINLITGFSKLSGCDGDFTYTACTLKSAVGLYDVSISEGEVTLLSADPTIVAVANNSVVNKSTGKYGGHYSTLGGIVEILNNYWTVVAIVGFVDGEQTIVGYELIQTEFFLKEAKAETCNVYDDPQPIVMKSINELMFRTGVYAASSAAAAGAHTVQLDPGLSHSYNVTGQVEGLHNVYITDYRWFVAAAIVEIVCIALVLPTYNRWWKLGRTVSLSPLETAKAFDAPALSSCHSNSRAAEIARTLGDVPIRYGVAATTSGTTKLAFGDPMSIENPQKDARFLL